MYPAVPIIGTGYEAAFARRNGRFFCSIYEQPMAKSGQTPYILREMAEPNDLPQIKRGNRVHRRLYRINVTMK